MTKQNNIFLTSHGLDTIGNVTLNGHRLGYVENMFVRYRWPVKDLLVSGSNKLEVCFESAPAFARKEYERYMKEVGYPFPPVILKRGQHGEDLVQYMRKMQSSFSWDWVRLFRFCISLSSNSIL